MVKLIPVSEAVGMVLGHDVTEIVPGRVKGPDFKRGHVIQPEDVSRLRDLGKENIAALDLEPDLVHEDEAALCLATGAAGPGIKLSQPSEGKVNLIASSAGLLKVNIDALNRLNSVPDVMMATLHTNQMVNDGQIVASTRIIPLTIKKESLQICEGLCSKIHPIISIKPVRSLIIAFGHGGMCLRCRPYHYPACGFGK